jgi:hypothetical protein
VLRRTLAGVEAATYARLLGEAHGNEDLLLLDRIAAARRRLNDEAYVASQRRLALTAGWTSYVLVVVTFLATMAVLLISRIAGVDPPPWPLAGLSSGLLLFGWILRQIVRGAEPRSERDPTSKSLSQRMTGGLMRTTHEPDRRD